MRLAHVFCAAALAVGVASAASAQTPATITVTSTTLKAGETIPKDHTADGKNVSPALMWTGAPAGTKQFALILDDPDAQFGGLRRAVRAAGCARPRSPMLGSGWRATPEPPPTMSPMTSSVISIPTAWGRGRTKPRPDPPYP